MRPLQEHQGYWGHCNKNLVESRHSDSEICGKNVVLSCHGELSRSQCKLPICSGVRELRETDSLLPGVKLLVETTIKRKKRDNSTYENLVFGTQLKDSSRLQVENDINSCYLAVL